MKGTVLFFISLLFVSRAESVCIREWKANLRKGPSTSFKKSWEVGKYMPFHQLGRKGSWVKLKDVDGRVHWAHATLLTRSVSCVVVKSLFTYLRKGPGTNFPKTDEWLAERYTPYKKLEERGAWMHVEDARRKKFWIAKKNLWEPLSIQRVQF